MATFKACVRTPRNDGLYSVFIRVTHNRVARYIATNKTIDNGKLRKGEIRDPAILSYCSTLIRQYAERLNAVDISSWDINEVIRYLTNIDEDISFSKYAMRYIFRMADDWGMKRNSKNYNWALLSLQKYLGKSDVMFSDLTTKTIQNWINSLSATSRAKEMYPVCIRMMYNAAMDEFNDEEKNIIRIKRNPFKKIVIPKADVPEKRAVSVEVLQRFFNAPVPESKMKDSLSELGRDVAEMVFCLAGMNTADLFELRKDNLRDGILCYHRQKTKKFRRDGAYLEVKMPKRLMSLFEKYKSDNDYLLNFNLRYQDSNIFNVNVNNGIKKFCKANDLPNLCVYTFRHSWATIAQNECGASTAEVGFALNHSSAHRVTEGYIRKDYSPISILNQKVIAVVFPS